MSRPNPERANRRPGWVADLTDAAVDQGLGPLSQLNRGHDGSGRRSAVLMALGDFSDGPGVLLLQRSTAMRNHPGQVAFPGGATDPGDAGPTGTALREATEEVGLDPASVDVLAELAPLFLPPSGFLVTPVLAWWRTPHEVGVVDSGEVARVEVVPVGELADPANRFMVALPRGGRGVAFAARDLLIWGFTAGLLDHLLRLGGWAREWDTDRVRELPGSARRPASGTHQSDAGTVAS